MFPFHLAVAVMVLASFHSVLGAGLCKSKDWWYDIQFGKCRPCTVCTGKSLKIEDCTQFMDTMCADLLEIERSIDRNIEKGRLNAEEQSHKASESNNSWLQVVASVEMENPEDKGIAFHSVVGRAIPSSVSRHSLGDFVHDWEKALFVVLCITITVVGVSVVILIHRYTGKILSRCGNRKNNGARLFSRDRFNTTEYMHNLATIDRGLAMDEILEKRKKAIFEPRILAENLYSDDVFVDVPGFRRSSAQDDHDYEELDYRKCLLQIREQ